MAKVWNRLFASGPAVLSFQAEADRSAAAVPRTQLRLLMAHLLQRFLHHELLASENEASRVLQIAYAAALPTLLVSLFLFMPYHAVPPAPHPRPYWSQVSDHYFFVMYSFVLMGLATVYEWDLLFPDLLDVYVLSVLPIPGRILFTARVLAVCVFLAVVLVGTSSLGIVFFPLVAALPAPGRHCVAHAVAVLLSGSFGAGSFLALQGVLLNVLGERWFRRMGPLLQGLSLLLLLAVLLLTPTVNRDIHALLTSSSAAVRWFPPFWFLGIYQRLLDGPTVPSLFASFAAKGVRACLAAALCVALTYPLAYRRRVRQLIEGEASAKPTSNARVWHAVLHKSLLRRPANRATFHLASQTVLRMQRHRLMLALYGGLTLALALSVSLVFRVQGGQLRPVLLERGLRAAVPLSVLLTATALRAAVWAPVDRRGAWLHRSILGRPRPVHLDGTKRWVCFWAAAVGLGMTTLVTVAAPRALGMPRTLVDQCVLSIGLALVVTDLYLYRKQSLPFTDLRVESITDLPLTLGRNFVLLPALIAVIVKLEPGIERSWIHLVELTFWLGAIHWAISRLYRRSLQHLNAEVLVSDEDVFPQGLGLREG